MPGPAVPAPAADSTSAVHHQPSPPVTMPPSSTTSGARTRQIGGTWDNLYTLRMPKKIRKRPAPPPLPPRTQQQSIGNKSQQEPHESPQVEDDSNDPVMMPAPSVTTHDAPPPLTPQSLNTAPNADDPSLPGEASTNPLQPRSTEEDEEEVDDEPQPTDPLQPDVNIGCHKPPPPVVVHQQRGRSRSYSDDSSSSSSGGGRSTEMLPLNRVHTSAPGELSLYSASTNRTVDVTSKSSQNTLGGDSNRQSSFTQQRAGMTPLNNQVVEYDASTGGAVVVRDGGGNDGALVMWTPEEIAKAFRDLHIEESVLRSLLFDEYCEHLQRHVQPQYQLERAVIVGLDPLRRILRKCVNIWKAKKVRHKLSKQRALMLERTGRGDIIAECWEERTALQIDAVIVEEELQRRRLLYHIYSLSYGLARAQVNLLASFARHRLLYCLKQEKLNRRLLLESVLMERELKKMGVQTSRAGSQYNSRNASRRGSVKTITLSNQTPVADKLKAMGLLDELDELSFCSSNSNNALMVNHSVGSEHLTTGSNISDDDVEFGENPLDPPLLMNVESSRDGGSNTNTTATATTTSGSNPTVPRAVARRATSSVGFTDSPGAVAVGGGASNNMTPSTEQLNAVIRKFRDRGGYNKEPCTSCHCCMLFQRNTIAETDERRTLEKHAQQVRVDETVLLYSHMLVEDEVTQRVALAEQQENDTRRKFKMVRGVLDRQWLRETEHEEHADRMDVGKVEVAEFEKIWFKYRSAPLPEVATAAPQQQPPAAPRSEDSGNFLKSTSSTFIVHVSHTTEDPEGENRGDDEDGSQQHQSPVVRQRVHVAPMIAAELVSDVLDKVVPPSP